ncbi:MAG: hypothetical protein DRI52_11970 [Chloroflexi bacterium]|nr:MAG: hypothetical protein DRI52_11970 [Chloroflexota bacterium]
MPLIQFMETITATKSTEKGWYGRTIGMQKFTKPLTSLMEGERIHIFCIPPFILIQISKALNGKYL